MKKINIQCYDNGRATLKTKDIHIESENIASIIEVDFSQTEYKDYQKGIDIKSGSYLLRYFLGNDEIVFKELTYENTLPGELVVTPFVFDEATGRKVRYLTDYSAIIHKRRSIVSQDVPDNVDIILEEIQKFIEDTMGKMVVDMVFNKDTNLLSLILENGAEISTIIDVDVDGVTIVWNEDNEIQLSPLLVDEINTSKDRIETLETKEVALKGRVDVLEPKVQTNINDINNLDARIGNAESDIEDINLKDTGQDNRLDIIESDIQDLDAHNIRFNGSDTNYLVGKTEVESSLKKLDQVIKEIDYINIQNQDTSEMQKLRLYVVGGQIGYKIEGGE